MFTNGIRQTTPFLRWDSVLPVLASGHQRDEKEDQEEHQDRAERNISPAEAIENDSPDAFPCADADRDVHVPEVDLWRSRDGLRTVNSGN